MYIAHRGLHDDIVPENSLLSFTKAIEAGYDIELDIQMTKDDVLVIFHDDNTSRMTGVSKNITKSTYNEIKDLKLKDTNEKIPTLDEVLDLVNGKVFLDIEIKRRRQRRKYLRLIKKHLDKYNGEYSIKSFDPTIPRWYKKHSSHIKCGVLDYNHNDYKAPKFFRECLRNCNYLFWYTPDFIAYKLKDYTAELDEKFKKHNISVMLWTITTDDERKKALKYTDNIIFEKIKIDTKYNYMRSTNMKIEEIKRYSTFIYDDFKIEYEKNSLIIKYYYEIVGLKKFEHKIIIPVSNENLDKEYIDKLVFNLGLLELVSYWKATISSNIIINCGNITEKQKSFFKKIYYNGLGEFFYTNNIKPEYESFVQITGKGKYYTKDTSYNGHGSMIAIGGGKDSCVTLSLYPKENTSCFIINSKSVMIDCALAAGYKNDNIIEVKRSIDKGLLELNQEGYLNGHTPFSAMVAFLSYLTAYLNNKDNIVLSNESSANEANVHGTKINHQYSKTYEFEHDFEEYAKEFLGGKIRYFSFLRPLTEYQIGLLFAKRKDFHKIFRSCNVGSKDTKWKWCCNCSKCLFVYSLLSPHLYKEELIDIFGEDLFANSKLLKVFKEMLGKENIKPFDCVGTYEEINYAITTLIKKLDKTNLPILLDYYYHNYYDEAILNKNLEKYYDKNNSLLEQEERIIKEAIQSD